MKKQTEATYRPELTFTRVEIRANGVYQRWPVPSRWTIGPIGLRPPTSGPILTASGSSHAFSPTQPNAFSAGEYQDDQESSGVAFKEFNVAISNIGFGAARDVSIRWAFPVEHFITAINELAEKATVPVRFSCVESDGLTLTSDIWRPLGPAIGPFLFPIEDKQFIDFILPETIQPAGSRSIVRIPQFVVQLVSAYFYVALKVNPNLSDLQVPILRSAINYYDLGGIKRCSSFDLQFHTIHPIQYHPEHPESMPIYQLTIDPNKVL